MLFSKDPKRLKVGTTAGEATFRQATLKANQRVGEVAPLVGVVIVGGREVFGAYGVDWWDVMSHLQTWVEAHGGEAS